MKHNNVFQIKKHSIALISVLILIYLIIHKLLIGRFWLWNITSVIPPVFYLLLAVASVYISILLIFKHLKSIYLVNIFVSFASIWLAIGISDLNLYFLHQSAAKSEEDISIFNWNTEFWENEQDLENLYEFLQKQNADIYNLQEFIPVVTSQDGKYVEVELSRLEEYFPDHELINRGEFVSLSKYPIRKVYNTVDYKFLKYDIEVEEDILTIYNVHLPMQFSGPSAFRSFPDEFSQIKSQFKYRQYVINKLSKDIAKANSPYIISGDFNTTKSMGIMDELLDEHKDSYKLNRRIIPTTWNKLGVRLWRIDYVLASEKVIFVGHKDIDPLNFSDHWGQLVTFRVE